MSLLLSQSQEIGRLSDGAFDVTIKPLVDLYQSYHAAGQGIPPPAQVARALKLVDWRRIEIADSRVVLPTPGMAITLDGIAKGYIVEEGVGVLQRFGFQNVMVSGAGDLFAAGLRAAGTQWEIGIRSPRREQLQLMARFAIRNRAAATSGDYLQPFTTDLSSHHILDPHTGYSAPEFASVTVVAPHAALADGLATALMTMNTAQTLAVLKRFPTCRGYFIKKDLEMLAFPNLSKVNAAQIPS